MSSLPMKPTRARCAVLALTVLTVCGACSSGSDGGSHAPSTTKGPKVTQPPVTITPPTIPSGPVVKVPATIDPTGQADVTRSLQQFISAVPNGRRILLRKSARYRLEGTLLLRDRERITIDGNGATVFATRRGSRDRAQFWIQGGKQIVFRNLLVRGANKHAGTSDRAYVKRLETQHGFRFEGVDGAEVDHVQVHNVYGDFVYIGRTKHRVPSRNVWVHDSRFSRNGRQGIAVTAASNVIIERNHIDQTRRSVFDLEPDTRSARVTNVFILNNTVGKGRFRFVAAHGRGAVSNVVISGNHLLGHSLTVDAGAQAPDPRRANWFVINNTSDTPVSRQPMTFFRIDGLAVRGNRQRVNHDQPAVVLIDVCGAQLSGNRFKSTRIRRTTAVCAAPLVMPKVPAFPGRVTTRQ